MPDIFLSYSREDQVVARRFAENLEREGFSVWWDQSLAAGEEFDAVTEKALDEARAVVVLWSRHSVNSRWVRAEATQAQANRRLVPVMIEPCRRPIMFELTHTAELSDWNGDPQDPSWRSFVAGLHRFAPKESPAGSFAPAQPAPRPPETRDEQPERSRTARRIAVAGGLVLVLGAAAFGLHALRSGVQSQSGMSLAQAVGELSELVQKDSYGAAFALGYPMAGSAAAKNNPEFQELWQQVVLPTKPLVAEAGATVYFRPHGVTDSPWIKAGVAPLAQFVSAPRGILSIRVEKPGFRTGEFVVANPGPSVENDPSSLPAGTVPVPLPLASDDTLPADMVLVPETNTTVAVGGITPAFAGGLQFPIPAFAISLTEVSNREFKEFVDAGGYDNAAYWEGLPFRDGSREISWNQARARFVDTTQRPGPASWQLGSYPEGQADLPVGGVSWYEAMAYARFRGRMLPTLHHWARAAQGPYDYRYGVGIAAALTGQFNASGPVPVQTARARGPWGTLNTYGNVREWMVNLTGQNALAMGGAWSDYAQVGLQAYSVPPMQRAPENGLRLMQLLPGTALDPRLLEPLRPPAASAAGPQHKPVGNEAFEAIRFQFSGRPPEPGRVIVQRVEETPLWSADEVTLEYQGRPPEVFYLIRPSGRRGPLQPVIFGPPADCCVMKRPNREILKLLRPPAADAVVRSGRALVMPVWDGSYEKFVQLQARDANEFQDLGRKRLLSWNQTLRSVLDNLQKVPDIDVGRAGYLGFSLGAATLAPSLLALEGRLRAAVLVSGGLTNSGGGLPAMLDNANYLPRVHMPVLMINGRFDHLYQFESSQKPMLELLGGPAGQKKQILYDVAHVGFPPNLVARDIDDWFDLYLGPTR